MYGNSVLVHSCFSQALGHPQPPKCNCKKEVAYEEAKRLVRIGEADWLVVFRKKARSGFPTSRAIVMETHKQTPRVQTIEKAHIERLVERTGTDLSKLSPAKQALIKEQLERMDAWQGISKDFRTALFFGVQLKAGRVVGGEPKFIPDPFEGRAILIMWDDERTSHGCTEEIDKSWDDILVIEQNEGLETALAATGSYRIKNITLRKDYPQVAVEKKTKKTLDKKA